MVHKAKTRLHKLQQIAEQLKRGEIVQNRTLQAWLGEAAYAAYEEAWSEQQELRAELKEKPDAVREYEARLRAATLIYNKGEVASLRGKGELARKLMNEADGHFERLNVYLQEILAADVGLGVWFDRNEDVSTYGLTPGTVPIVVTSRSMHNNSGGLLTRKRTKRDVKLDTVEHAINDLERGAIGEDELDDVQKVQLGGFLKQQDDDDYLA